MTRINYILLSFISAFILGTVFGYYLDFPPQKSMAIAVGIFLVLAGIFWWHKKRFKPAFSFSILSLCCAFFIGNTNIQRKKPKYINAHFLHYTQAETPTLTLRIDRVLKPTSFHDRYFASVLRIDSLQTKGKIQIDVTLDAYCKPLYVGNYIVVKAHIKQVDLPKNPYQFSYKKYLESQNVWGYIRLNKNLPFIKLPSHSKSLFSWAQNLREKWQNTIQESALSNTSKQLLFALALGNRNLIPEARYQAYADAGVVHILAVSGLHVGILFLIFSSLLIPLKHIRKGLVHFLGVVLLLWLYAFITGLSPSVLRATTMCSLFGISLLLKRRSGNLNLLFLSAFILLLATPLSLWQVGFQLSYTAVFFIIWLFPKFQALLEPKNKLFRFLWHTTAVTLSAQLGVLPLTLFYFNQFPGLFLVGNLVIVSVLPLILILCIVLVVWAQLAEIPIVLAQLFNTISHTLNLFIEWLAAQEAFIWKAIPFSLLEICTLYMVIGFAFSKFPRRNAFKKYFVLSSIILFLSSMHLENYKHRNPEMVVFHHTGSTLIGFKEGRQLKLLTKNGELTAAHHKIVTPYLSKARISKYTTDSLKRVFNYKGCVFVIIDNATTYPKENKGLCYIFINSPRVHFTQFLKDTNPHCVIADGSNYSSFTTRWAKTASAHQMPFYSTKKNGAWVFKVNN